MRKEKKGCLNRKVSFAVCTKSIPMTLLSRIQFSLENAFFHSWDVAIVFLQSVLLIEGSAFKLFYGRVTFK